MISKIHNSDQWPVKIPLLTITIYLTIVISSIIFLNPQVQEWNPFLFNGYIILVLIFFSLAKKIKIEQLGWNPQFITNHSMLGLVSGSFIIAAIPILNKFIEVTGLENTDLFLGANLRSEGLVSGTWTLSILWSVIWVPFIEQTFFSGFVLNSFLKKFKPSLAIYFTAIIFVLVHLDFRLGMFILGLINSVFYYLTGSVYASLLFHMASQIGGLLLVHFYPSVITLLSFLF